MSEYWPEYVPEETEWTVLGVNEYTLNKDGTEIIASWEGNYERLVDFECYGGLDGWA